MSLYFQPSRLSILWYLAETIPHFDTTIEPSNAKLKT